MTSGYGKQAGLSARGGLLLTGLLVAAVLWLLFGSADAANARARSATEYAWRTGPQADIAMWSDDGEHWRNVDATRP
uniref:Uncharacterized protein n=1 Tax=viral metagenome TaxID=1070528 RepID=A0A6M3Y0T9_9ZZZZ